VSLFSGHTGRIFAYNRPVDMRNSFNGLAAVILQTLKEDPMSGDLFVFINRRGHLLKCFLWDRTGYVVVAKRLESGKARLRGRAEKLEIDSRRLKLLFDGVMVGGFPRATRKNNDIWTSEQ
jgi:transposase